MGLAAIVCMVATTSCNGQKKGTDKNTALTTTIDSVSYGIGVSIGENLVRDGLDSVNVDLIAQGMRAVMKKDSVKITSQQAGQIIQAYVGQMAEVKSKAARADGDKFLVENKKKDGVVTLPSGLQYKVIKMGTGPKPLATDTVTTHYHGTLVDGTVFDSSVERGEPVSFPVGGVIQGWVEALQLMPTGSKWKLFIPSDLGYGDQGAGGVIGPGAVLIFDVELIGINMPKK